MANSFGVGRAIADEQTLNLPWQLLNGLPPKPGILPVCTVVCIQRPSTDSRPQCQHATITHKRAGVPLGGVSHPIAGVIGVAGSAAANARRRLGERVANCARDAQAAVEDCLAVGERVANCARDAQAAVEDCLAVGERVANCARDAASRGWRVCGCRRERVGLRGASRDATAKPEDPAVQGFWSGLH
jgi:hypothetical protein